MNREPVRTTDIAQQGRDRIEFARMFMPVTMMMAREARTTGSLKGLKIGVVLVLEPKTGALALELAAAGAEVSVYAAARSTHADVAAALNEAGLNVYASADATEAQEHEYALSLLDTNPDILLDDGSTVIRLGHSERPDVMRNLRGASEETTSGLRPLRQMAHEGTLLTPVLAANDAQCKTLFDNGYGTGESCVMTILDALNWSARGLNCVVAGYGYVGRGVSRVLNALGATVTIAEVDPVKALEARFAGFNVAPLRDAAEAADLVISATGIAHTLDSDLLHALPSSSAVAVAGGVPEEISLTKVREAGAKYGDVRPGIQKLTLISGTEILVLNHGLCINTSYGEGNPIDNMDLSFGVQFSSVLTLAGNHQLPVGVHSLPSEIDDRVARAALSSQGITIDTPTPDQERFLAAGLEG